MKKINYFLLLGAAILVPTVLWFFEKDYLKQSSESVIVDSSNQVELENSAGKFVELVNHCTYDFYVESTKGHELVKEIMPIVQCDSTNPDSSFLFLVFENTFGMNLTLVGDNIEEADLSEIKGELQKLTSFSAGERKIIDEIGIAFKPSNSYILVYGKSPESTKMDLIIIAIISLSISVILCIGFTIYERKKQKRIALVLELIKPRKAHES